MSGLRKIMLVAGAGVMATAASAQPAGQKVTGPVATYWMSAATQTGFGMPGAGGGRPSVMEMMRMATGGGGSVNHALTLQLGSSQKPTGAPQADHLPPSTMVAGNDLPLLTPEVQPTPVREETERPSIPKEYQKPRGRMLIFWGCGEHARPGQPVVIDFSQLTPDRIAAGQMPAGMDALMRGISYKREEPPSPGRNATYGDWPNSKSRNTLGPQSSLVGEHTVRGDYSPEIKFALKPDQDFLAPLNLTTNAKLPSGAVQLAWNPVPNAGAYVAGFIGAGGQDTVVMWMSSETQGASFVMPDYISNPEMARLVQAKALMGPETTSCQVPKEAVDAGRQGLLQLIAYGHEANFVYPPRPTNPKEPWNRQWEVKVRYRSATGGMLGMAMPGAGGGRGGGGSPASQQTADQQPQQPPPDAAAERRKAILRGIGGLIPH